MKIYRLTWRSPNLLRANDWGVPTDCHVRNFSDFFKAKEARGELIDAIAILKIQVPSDWIKLEEIEVEE